MSIESQINKKERVDNKDRKFGSNLHYFPVYITDRAGEQHAALFTGDQLKEAMIRASKNPEDVPQRATWLDRIFE